MSRLVIWYDRAPGAADPLGSLLIVENRRAICGLLTHEEAKNEVEAFKIAEACRLRRGNATRMLVQTRGQRWVQANQPGYLPETFNQGPEFIYIVEQLAAEGLL